MNDKGLQRQIKKSIHAQPQRLRLEPAPGWDAVLRGELRQLLASFSLPSRSVPTLSEGEEIWLENLDFRNLIEVPLRLLTAADALWPLQSRHVGSFGELVGMAQDLPWELYLPAGARLHLKVLSYRSKLFHEGKIEELLGGVLREKGYALEEGEGSWRLVCEQIENRHTIYLSLGGEALYRRHYKRQHQHGAPLQEHLAAAALAWGRSLQEPGWMPDLFCVPFAGSGTFYMEQLLADEYLPAYRFRGADHYSVSQLVCLPQASWEQIIKRLDARPRRSLPAALLIEKDKVIAERLEANLAHFLMVLSPEADDAQPSVVCADVLATELPSAARVWMPLNPPYGLRLEQGTRDAPDFYRRLGRWLLAQNVSDLRGLVLIPDADSLRAFSGVLPEGAVQAVQSFTQGGQHIRCLSFRFGAGAGV